MGCNHAAAAKAATIDLILKNQMMISENLHDLNLENMR